MTIFLYSLQSSISTRCSLTCFMRVVKAFNDGHKVVARETGCHCVLKIQTRKKLVIFVPY